MSSPNISHRWTAGLVEVLIFEKRKFRARTHTHIYITLAHKHTDKTHIHIRIRVYNAQIHAKYTYTPIHVYRSSYFPSPNVPFSSSSLFLSYSLSLRQSLCPPYAVKFRSPWPLVIPAREGSSTFYFAYS